MTNKEQRAIRELIGKLKARQESLRQDIKATNELMPRMAEGYTAGYQQGRIDEMARWLGWSIPILAEVEALLTIENGKEKAK